MKIIIVAPKTITSHRKITAPFRFDLSYWIFYLPLLSLGHDVTFFDSSQSNNEDLSLLIEKKKPDLLFCITTGDPHYCPEEPWEAIIKETKSGRTKTFNWFCDDSWRFDSFSNKACWNFHACSTVNKRHIPKFKEIGYNNILYATWHANFDAYSNINPIRDLSCSFVGRLSADRKSSIEYLNKKGIDVHRPENPSFEDMIWTYSRSLIGLNFSKNSANSGTQMKGRMFEIPATKCMLLTEYTEGLEDCYEFDKEIICFKTVGELYEKLDFLIKNPKIAEDIGANGFKRFIKQHESKVRLSDLLKELEKT